MSAAVQESRPYCPSHVVRSALGSVHPSCAYSEPSMEDAVYRIKALLEAMELANGYLAKRRSSDARVVLRGAVASCLAQVQS